MGIAKKLFFTGISLSALTGVGFLMTRVEWARAEAMATTTNFNADTLAGDAWGKPNPLLDSVAGKLTLKLDLGYIYNFSSQWSGFNTALGELNNGKANGSVGFGGSLGWTHTSGFGLSADYLAFNSSWQQNGHNYYVGYQLVTLTPSYRFTFGDNNEWGLKLGFGAGIGSSHLGWGNAESSTQTASYQKSGAIITPNGNFIHRPLKATAGARYDVTSVNNDGTIASNAVFNEIVGEGVSGGNLNPESALVRQLCATSDDTVNAKKIYYLFDHTGATAPNMAMPVYQNTCRYLNNSVFTNAIINSDTADANENIIQILKLFGVNRTALNGTVDATTGRIILKNDYLYRFKITPNAPNYVVNRYGVSAYVGNDNSYSIDDRVKYGLGWLGDTITQTTAAGVVTRQVNYTGTDADNGWSKFLNNTVRLTNMLEILTANVNNPIDNSLIINLELPDGTAIPTIEYFVHAPITTLSNDIKKTKLQTLATAGNAQRVILGDITGTEWNQIFTNPNTTSTTNVTARVFSHWYNNTANKNTHELTIGELAYIPGAVLTALTINDDGGMAITGDNNKLSAITTALRGQGKIFNGTLSIANDWQMALRNNGTLIKNMLGNLDVVANTTKLGANDVVWVATAVRDTQIGGDVIAKENAFNVLKGGTAPNQTGNIYFGMIGKNIWQPILADSTKTTLFNNLITAATAANMEKLSAGDVVYVATNSIYNNLTEDNKTQLNNLKVAGSYIFFADANNKLSQSDWRQVVSNANSAVAFKNILTNITSANMEQLAANEVAWVADAVLKQVANPTNPANATDAEIAAAKTDINGLATGANSKIFYGALTIANDWQSHLLGNNASLVKNMLNNNDIVSHTAKLDADDVLFVSKNIWNDATTFGADDIAKQNTFINALQSGTGSNRTGYIYFGNSSNDQVAKADVGSGASLTKGWTSLITDATQAMVFRNLFYAATDTNFEKLVTDDQAILVPYAVWSIMQGADAAAKQAEIKKLADNATTAAAKISFGAEPLSSAANGITKYDLGFVIAPTVAIEYDNGLLHVDMNVRYFYLLNDVFYNGVGGNENDRFQLAGPIAMFIGAGFGINF